jgi:hypothetical protein
MRRVLITTMLTGSVFLAGCADLPDLRPMSPRAAAPLAAPPPPPTALGDIGIRRSASAAEAACVAQGETQGMGVQGVVGTREVTGADGRPASRDVMLRVARGQQVFEVRCSYDYASGQARIMTL